MVGRLDLAPVLFQPSTVNALNARIMPRQEFGGNIYLALLGSRKECFPTWRWRHGMSGPDYGRDLRETGSFHCGKWSQLCRPRRSCFPFSGRAEYVMNRAFFHAPKRPQYPSRLLKAKVIDFFSTSCMTCAAVCDCMANFIWVSRLPDF